jgi:heat shock protein HslJ
MKKISLLIALLVVLAVALPAQQTTSSLNGSWKLVSASGNIIFKNIPEAQIPQLRFETAENSVTGFTGCNRLSGQFTVEKDQLTLGPIITTKKACENMEIELTVGKFLTNVGFYKVEQDKLYLYDKADRNNYLLFSRMNETI